MFFAVHNQCASIYLIGDINVCLTTIITMTIINTYEHRVIYQLTPLSAVTHQHIWTKHIFCMYSMQYINRQTYSHPLFDCGADF